MGKLSAAESLAQQLQSLARVEVALYTVAVVEYIHLLPNEIQFIWTKWDGRRSVVNFLYIMSRYSQFFDPAIIVYGMNVFITDKGFCHSFGIATLWLTMFGALCAEIAFFLRVCALWQDGRAAKFFLVLVMIGYTVLQLISCALATQSSDSHVSLIPSLCALTSSGPNDAKIAMQAVLGMLFFDIILMAMTITAKFKFQYRLGADSLAKKVYRDAVYYFVLNFFVAVASALIYYESPGLVKQLTGEFSSTATRILSCRVILRFRESNQSDMGPLTEVTEIQFGTNPHLRNGSEGSAMSLQVGKV
ncbi:hypothetical protein P691DRAFT_759828 [Macrolepiota fuliginosa MF-IS2]|uniref:DUF6533 domain-containing protein n=1 Tax=Macrolepiota fuliginosa MF-IS2 TaxID=1400762 RepID=A0A9P5XEW0_9AGAR|nr:hypothetical protein P691DRAFT_759828 [Macrolepiota fuliginosa MF-IS2]